jgi:hypothetical protein
VAETNILIVDLCEDIKQYSDTLENSSIIKKYPEILLAAIIDDNDVDQIIKEETPGVWEFDRDQIKSELAVGNNYIRISDEFISRIKAIIAGGFFDLLLQIMGNSNNKNIKEITNVAFQTIVELAKLIIENIRKMNDDEFCLYLNMLNYKKNQHSDKQITIKEIEDLLPQSIAGEVTCNLTEKQIDKFECCYRKENICLRYSNPNNKYLKNILKNMVDKQILDYDNGLYYFYK